MVGKRVGAGAACAFYKTLHLHYVGHFQGCKNYFFWHIKGLFQLHLDRGIECADISSFLPFAFFPHLEITALKRRLAFLSHFLHHFSLLLCKLEKK